jgi:hypothetical protein
VRKRVEFVLSDDGSLTVSEVAAMDELLRDRYPGIERAVQRMLIPGDAQGSLYVGFNSQSGE